MRGRRMTAARQEARIRQLCCLGLGSESVMPALLEELHALVPSRANTFLWVGPEGHLANIYDEQPEAAATASLYVSEFYNRRECEVSLSFSEAARLERGVLVDQQFLTVSQRAFYRSDFYNQVLRPIGYGHCLRMVVREDGRTLGFLQLQRRRREQAFGTPEIRRMQRLQAFVTHAMTRCDADPERMMAESGESGLVIVDPQGRPAGLSPRGRQLLFLATHPRLDARTKRQRDARLPAPVRALCERLHAVCTNDAAAVIPVLRHRNVWGGFVFRAYQLDAGSCWPGYIGIAVTREVPLRLRLTRGALNLCLSGRQTEVAVLLAAGCSHQQIADQLGIARNTVIAHARWAYSKLSVHDGRALRERLLAATG